MTSKPRQTFPNDHNSDSLANSEGSSRDEVRNENISDLLNRYVRRSACAAAAGMGAFGLTSQNEAAINVYDPSTFAPPQTFLERHLVGNPYNSAPIENNNLPGDFPFASTGWASAGLSYQYGGYYTPSVSFGLDLDFYDNYAGNADIGFFRGQGYAGYLIVNATTAGYAYAPVPASGRVTLLSNDTENPDSNGLPATGGGKQLLQGFNAGQIIGDGNDTSLGTNEGVMRDAYSIGDWDGVDDNYGNNFDPNDPLDGVSSYVGFQISGLSTGTGTGFGWIEVIVREVIHPGFTNYSHPELQIIRWAFTDDGTPIAAGDDGLAVIDTDFNDDDRTDAIDFLIQQRNFSTGTTNSQGDTNGDMVINEVDLANWEGNYGTPLVSATSSVPEPTTLGLLAAGAGALALRRRRNRED